MKVFKFGGASVKDAESVKNLTAILSLFDMPLVIVVSAMGKTTNALEKVVNACYHHQSNLPELISEVKDYHFQIIDKLGFSSTHPVRDLVANVFVDIDWNLDDGVSRDYNFLYDQVVSQGELLSTHIVSAYLQDNGFSNRWIDIRDCLITDNTYRDAKVNWQQTEKLMQQQLKPILNAGKRIVTQGFIGATTENFSVTLGREGSDYTAAIISHCLHADEMIVWKDVPGVLSADPKFFDDAVKLEQISYHDAIELTYYGATVIHPKTIKPLENKNIPLSVRSFKSPREKGTSIGNYTATKPLVPCFIFKTNQILISISAKDFSFIAEESLSQLFSLFASHHVKINLMQNSAISFSVCIDHDPFRVPELLTELQRDFKILYNENLRLVTVRHYYASTIEALTKGKTILLEQRSRHTAQVVIKE